MTGTDRAFGELTEKTREERGMSKTSLARLIWPGVEDQTVLMRYNRLISGNVKLDTAAAVAKALGIDLARMIVIAQEGAKEME